jgi:hypothetical protein
MRSIALLPAHPNPNLSYARCMLLRAISRSALLTSLLACLALSACSHARKPSVIVDSATLEQSSNPQQADTPNRTVLVRLLASNPSDQPIPLRQISYELRAGSYSSGPLSRDAQRTIPRFGTTALTLPVPVPADIAQQIATGGQWTIEGDVGYLPYAAWRRTLYESKVILPTVPIESAR